MPAQSIWSDSVEKVVAQTRILTPNTCPDDIEVDESIEVDTNLVCPPTRGRITPLVDGKDAFREMYDKISKAQKYIYLTIWWIHPKTRLKPARGSAKRLTALLKGRAAKGVRVRVLLNYLDCIESIPLPTGRRIKKIGYCYRPRNEQLRNIFERLHKNVSARVVAHPHEMSVGELKFVNGSFHEKLMIIDGQYAFCGGINFVPSYTFADQSHKRGWIHDVHSLIEGPVVKHLEQYFVSSWKERRDYRIQKASQGVPELGDPTAQYDPECTEHAVQVVATKATKSESESDRKTYEKTYKTVDQGILRAYMSAVSAAEKYIYIEQQFFRDKALTDALINRLKEQPELQLIIVLPQRMEEKRDAFFSHGEYVQRKRIEQLTTVSREVTQDVVERTGVFSLRLGPGGGAIYVHSKVMIVDDKWLTIGSANATPRAFRLDSEINIVVRDDELARDLRVALWKEHLGLRRKRRLPKELDIKRSNNFVRMWKKQATANDNRIRRGKKLKGRAVTHKPAKGKPLPWYLRLLMPGVDPDEFASFLPPQPIMYA